MRVFHDRDFHLGPVCVSLVFCGCIYDRVAGSTSVHIHALFFVYPAHETDIRAS